MPEARFGWDVGGAHLKVARLGPGDALPEVGQWPCRLWTGLPALQEAVAAACARWPALASPQARHALTMSGEMVDAFPDRAAGVQALVQALAAWLPGRWTVYAGEGPDGRWARPAEAAARAAAIASANWQATAAWVGRQRPEALLVDLGSTTTDLIVLRAGRPVEAGATDAQRLRSGALVYQGVVRTPLCALGPTLDFQGGPVGLMNELFATSADVHRLLGGLDPAHDQQPSADGGPKDAAGSRRRLARMVGCDVADAPASAWQALAAAFRDRQLERLEAPLRALIARHGLPPGAPLVAAGCGDFLVPELAARLGRPLVWLGPRGVTADPGEGMEGTDPQAAQAARWARVAAPCLAVAALAREDETSAAQNHEEKLPCGS